MSVSFPSLSLKANEIGSSFLTSTQYPFEPQPIPGGLWKVWSFLPPS